MALNYENLDERTRQFMFMEVDLDISLEKIYISPRLNSQGQQNYISLLKEAIRNHEDAWHASELRHLGFMKDFEERRKPKGGFSRSRVPITAPDTLAEGEYNRFYVRGLCMRAIEEGIQEVEVYRGKHVSQPRPESEVIIGKRIPVKILLEYLRRSQGFEPALGIPPGPNSGLTVRIP